MNQTNSAVPTAVLLCLPFHVHWGWGAPGSSREAYTPSRGDRGPCIFKLQLREPPELSTVCRHLCFVFPVSASNTIICLTTTAVPWHPVWWYPPENIFFQNLYNIRFKKQTVFSGGPGATTLCSQCRESGVPSLAAELIPHATTKCSHVAK